MSLPLLGIFEGRQLAQLTQDIAGLEPRINASTNPVHLSEITPSPASLDALALGLAAAIPIDQVIDLATSLGDKSNVDGVLAMSQ